MATIPNKLPKKRIKLLAPGYYYTVIKVNGWKRINGTNCYTNALSNASYSQATIYDQYGVFVETYEEE